MTDCIFCKLVEGTLPSQKVYEDEKVVAILNIEPIRPGHLLIIPKQHYKYVFSLPKADYLALMAVAYKLAPVLDKVFKPKRVGLFVAGWDVAHAHVHLLPMKDPEDLTSKRELDGQVVMVDAEDLQADRDRIIANLKLDEAS